MSKKIHLFQSLWPVEKKLYPSRSARERDLLQDLGVSLPFRFADEENGKQPDLHSAREGEATVDGWTLLDNPERSRRYLFALCHAQFQVSSRLLARPEK